jgi:hypothetical protein
MPRNSAFKKATRAFARTREFFSYESPYLRVVPASEACHGPCCAGVSTAATSSSSEAAPEPAHVDQLAPEDVVEAAKLPENDTQVLTNMSAFTEDMAALAAQDEGESGEVELYESKSSDEDEDEDDDDDDDDEQVLPAELNTTNNLCDAKTCLTAQLAGVRDRCDTERVEAYANTTKAKDGQYNAATKNFPEWAEKKKEKARKHIDTHADAAGGADVDLTSLEELREQILAEKDLRDVLRWACEKIIKVTMPLGDRALEHMMAMLVTSAKLGSRERVKDARKVNAVHRATVLDPKLTEVALPLGRRASQQMEGLRTAIAEAAIVEKSICETLEGLRQHVHASVEQSSHSGMVDAKQEEKILNTITRAPMSDEEYEEVSTRSLYFNGVLPNFSENDVVKLICRYGNVEKCRVILHSRNHEPCWLGFFTMTTPEAADGARKALNGKIIGGHALIVERPPDAQLMRTVQTHLKRARTGKPIPDSAKGKEQKDAKTEERLTYADKRYLAERLQQLNGKEMDEVGEIIAVDKPAVKGTSKCKVEVDLDDLSDIVLLKLLAYFWKRFGCAPEDARSRMVSQPAVIRGESKGMLEIPAVAPKIGETNRRENTFESVIKDGNNKRQRNVTKWDLLRGLKLTAQNFLQIGTAMANEQFGRFNDPSVINAPNLPTGAYTILRNDLLAENIKTLLEQLRDASGGGGFDQLKGIRAASRDPVAKRWKTLQRDFPDVRSMISGLQPERDRIRDWVVGGSPFSSSCFYIVAADEKSADAIAQALGDEGLHGPDDLTAFTRRLAEIDKDTRFQVQKQELTGIDPRETRCKELLELGIKIIERYPGLGRLIRLETELPYHPNHEEGDVGEEC